MELIKSAARRSLVSDILYIVLNLGLAGGVFALVYADLAYLAFIFVVLSKWRVFAVRPRFWFANFQANLVDLLVGLSATTLILLAVGSPVVQAALAALYAVWLIALKPRTKRKWVVIQAAVSQFVSLWALFSVAYLVPVIVVVAVAWLIGYATARHTLTIYDEEERTFMSLVWGLLLAQIAWIAYHWTIAYTPFSNVTIPQVAIIVAALGFASVKVYEYLCDQADKKKRDGLRAPLVFCGVLLFIIVFLLGGLDTSQL